LGMMATDVPKAVAEEDTDCVWDHELPERL
jgi:hypothetical protein